MAINRSFLKLTAIFILLIGLFILFRSQNQTNPEYHQFDITLTDSELEKYRALSIAHCTACHVYPEPHLLPKDVWLRQTLPAMGPLLGIFEFEGVQYPKDTREHVPKGTYPTTPAVTLENWEKILKFYAHSAPDSFSKHDDISEIVIDSLYFRSHTADYKTDNPPASTIAKFEPENQKIYVSDIDGTNLLIFDHQLQLENTLYLAATLADIQITHKSIESNKRELLLTYIGSLLPSDAPEGFIVKTEYNPQLGPGERGGAIETVLENIVRPVQSQIADLDLDGREDLLVHEFGHRTGRLFWLKNRGGGQPYEKRILINTPGCIQSHVTDYTQNGLPDVISLCTQADQAIYLFENQGRGEFSRNTLLKFPITADSTSFEMHDFNGDGHPDILYTSGDNADFSITFKPYHGVYIYLNDGNGNFHEEWFYPVNGAYDAKARDFNGDGHLDIVVISYFADYVNRPEEGFLFFKNEGRESLSFTPYHHPAASSGRWIAMDVADWTGNGYDDILLANFSLGPDVGEAQAQMDKVFTKGPLFLLLENRCPEDC